MSLQYDLMIMRKVEALLFTQKDPVSSDQLALWLDMDPRHIPDLLESFGQYLQSRQSGLCVRQIAGGYLLATAPDLSSFLDERLGRQAPEPLSAAAWEVLAIIAYKQPITRLEIEALRQTNSERALDTLVNRELIEQVGRKEAPGRPILYGTTVQFLKEFGLDSLEQLPPLPLLPQDSSTSG
ncbi:segregation and condensation protein B [Sulfobacillus thermosulfidooxidans DSM 9293]|uniref:Segregation and condensation protein B n=1 Tax=Sulfobacillus thermosulfidooxidans (strain DSM 9293 / VKM B-1269 / AT-1) TaxID=929705 RepID=A0A1W1WJJ0_SULTA|nr:SMC-Scp complex subunit ScpB [Sulfobacillus thermosulfidooxidans]SMC06437.1 segregation and condensation protein B [Sulfobacillus thermosulfidooxidans DSM 9293]